MFLKPPQAGQTPGKPTKTSAEGIGKKRKLSDEELKERDREYDRTKRCRKFLSHWPDKWTWLEHDQETELVFCKICRAHPSYADKDCSLFKGYVADRSTGFDAHQKSVAHQRCVQRQKVADGEQSPVLAGVHRNGSIDPRFQKQMENMMHVAYYIAKREKSFTDFPDLVELCKTTGSDMPQWYRSDKACARFLVSIYDQERAEMLDQLRRARFISVCIDGATDTGKLENEIVYVKFWNDKMGVLQCFLGIEDVKFANADGVIQAIDTVFKEAGIPDWREKIVFLAADGASVNMGKKNGVAAKLRREVEYLLAIHCVAHRLELGVNDAVRENPQLKRLQEVLVYLYEQYDYSPKALRELRMLGEALEEKVLKPTTLKGARWLPYIHRATKILCTSYKVFVAHFEDMVSSERRPQPSAPVMGRAMNILRYLKDAKNLQFMHFWCDALEVLKILSEQFQRDSLTPGEAVQYQEACCAGLIELSLQPGVEQSKVIGSITSFSKYQGVELTNISADTLKKEREEITETMIDHLQKRLGDLYSNSVISKFRALDHTLWPELDNDKHSKEAFVLHGRDQIGGLVEHYEEVFKRHGVDPGSVLHQFRLYKTWAKNCQTSMRNTLITVLKREDLKKRFDALAILMEIYVVMSVSTAMCERGFSCMKRVKSDWRSSLTTIQLNRLMYISLEGPTCDKFVALNSVNYWWGGAAVRKPGFTAWKQRIEQPTDEELERELEEIDREMEASRDAEDAARERLNHVTESKEDKEGVDREATEDA